MKNILYFAAIFSFAAMSSCGSNSETDSKKIADSINTAKIDSAKSADTVASAPSHLAELKTDAEFVVSAADGGMLEVQLGKLAEQKSHNKSVKSFGAMMVRDHSKADEQLKKLASSKNIAIPATLSDKCQKQLSDLSAKNGTDFDKDYASAMVSGHKDNIDMFKKEADNGKDSAIVQWARGKLPTLEHHLDMAEQTDKVVNK
ncbi:MAG TPA: DUF4142 domain-containing protein [Puia sp.]|jgi:putative membrane protein